MTTPWPAMITGFSASAMSCAARFDLARVAFVVGW